MNYHGLCLDGPRGGQVVHHMHDVLELPVRTPVPPSESYGDGVFVLSALRVDRFRYHAVQIMAGTETLRFWIPEEWYNRGQTAYTVKIITFLSEQYASGT